MHALGIKVAAVNDLLVVMPPMDEKSRSYIWHRDLSHVFCGIEISQDNWADSMIHQCSVKKWCKVFMTLVGLMLQVSHALSYPGTVCLPCLSSSTIHHYIQILIHVHHWKSGGC